MARQLVNEWIVEHEQGLRRHTGHVATTAGQLQIGEIERGQKLGRSHDRHHQIERASPIPIDRSGEESLRTILDGPRRQDRTAIQRRVEASRDGQKCVAKLFGLQSASRIMVPQAVVRITLIGLGVDQPRFPECPRQDQLPHESLGRPPLPHEVAGQPVEQFRMGRAVSQSPEVIGSRDEPCAKHPLPDTIDVDARGQGMFGMQERLGQFKTTTAGTRRDRLIRTKHRQRRGHDDIPHRVDIATDVEEQTRLYGGPLVHAVDGAGKLNRLLNTAILLDQ